MKYLGVGAVRKEPEFFGIKTLGHELLLIDARRHVDHIHLFVKPAQVPPGRGFHRLVLGVVLNVLGQVCVVNAHHSKVEHFPDGQRCQARQSGRADDEFIKLFAIAILENVEQRGKGERDCFILAASGTDPRA